MGWFGEGEKKELGGRGTCGLYLGHNTNKGSKTTMRGKNTGNRTEDRHRTSPAGLEEDATTSSW